MDSQLHGAARRPDGRRRPRPQRLRRHATATHAPRPTEAPASQCELPAGDITIGVAFPNSDTFLSRVQDGMKAEAAAKGVTVNITDAKDDTAAQLSQVENFVSQKVDAIIVVPVDTSAAQPMADAAKAANIPIVFVNRNPSIAGVPYVGFRLAVRGPGRDGAAREAGRRQG